MIQLNDVGFHFMDDCGLNLKVADAASYQSRNSLLTKHNGSSTWKRMRTSGLQLTVFMNTKVSHLVLVMSRFSRWWFKYVGYQRTIIISGTVARSPSRRTLLVDLILHCYILYIMFEFRMWLDILLRYLVGVWFNMCEILCNRQRDELGESLHDGRFCRDIYGFLICIILCYLFALILRASPTFFSSSINRLPNIIGDRFIFNSCMVLKVSSFMRPSSSPWSEFLNAISCFDPFSPWYFSVCYQNKHFLCHNLSVGFGRCRDGYHHLLLSTSILPMVLRKWFWRSV